MTATRKNRLLVHTETAFPNTSQRVKAGRWFPYLKRKTQNISRKHTVLEVNFDDFLQGNILSEGSMVVFPATGNKTSDTFDNVRHLTWLVSTTTTVVRRPEKKLKLQNGMSAGVVP